MFKVKLKKGMLPTKKNLENVSKVQKDLNIIADKMIMAELFQNIKRMVELGEIDLDEGQAEVRALYARFSHILDDTTK